MAASGAVLAEAHDALAAEVAVGRHDRPPG